MQPKVQYLLLGSLQQLMSYGFHRSCSKGSQWHFTMFCTLNDVTSRSSGLTLTGKQTRQMEYSLSGTDKARRTATLVPSPSRWPLTCARTHTHTHTHTHSHCSVFFTSKMMDIRTSRKPPDMRIMYIVHNPPNLRQKSGFMSYNNYF